MTNNKKPEQLSLPGIEQPTKTKKQIITKDLVIARAAEQAIEIRRLTNQVSIHKGSEKEPILRIIRHPDGTLESESQSVKPGRIWLPNPRYLPRNQSDRILFIQHLVKSIAQKAAASALQGTGYPVTYPKSHNWESQLVNEWAKKHRELSPAVHGRTQMWKFIMDVSSLIDPTAWELAEDIKGHVLIEAYNRAILNKEILAELRETNPGATAWATSRHGIEEKAYHPGQIIQAARPFMESIGVERRHWKKVASLDPSVMTELTRRHVPKYMTGIILNACGETNTEPVLEEVQYAISILLRCRRKTTRIKPERNRPNTRRNQRRSKHPKRRQARDQRRTKNKRSGIHSKPTPLRGHGRLRQRLHRTATADQVDHLSGALPGVRTMAPPNQPS